MATRTPPLGKEGGNLYISLGDGGGNGRLGHFILSFGRDSAGEVYVLTTDRSGPNGNTGKVYRLVKPGNGRR